MPKIKLWRLKWITKKHIGGPWSFMTMWTVLATAENPRPLILYLIIIIKKKIFPFFLDTKLETYKFISAPWYSLNILVSWK
jgi:hypothetical protein